MADDTEAITILLRARDKDLARAMDRSNKLIAKFERQSRTAMNQTQRNIDTGLAKIGGSLRTFAGGVLGGVLAGGVAAITTQSAAAIRSIADIGREAARAGVSAEGFQRLGYLATQSRIPIDALVDGMKELNLRADEFVVTGAGPGAEAFARLGLSATALKSALEDPEELLVDIVGRMEELERAAQIRVADEIFGGTAGERFVELLGQGEAGMREIMARADELGLVLSSDTIAKAEDLDRRFAEVQQRISTIAKTAVVELADAIRDVASVDFEEMLGGAERAVAILGNETVDALHSQMEVTEGQIRTVRGLVDVYEDLFSKLNYATGPDGLRLMDVADLDAAYELAGILTDIDREMVAFQNGKVSASEFEDSLSDLVGEATDVINSLDDIDKARFGNVISAISGIASALQAARQAAITLRQSLPGPGDGSSDGTAANVSYGPQNSRRRAPISIRAPEGRAPVAPSASVRPQLPGIDASFGSPAPSGGTGRAGGGRGGAASADAWQRAVQGLREEIQELEIEAESLLTTATFGQELGDALEYARKRAELLTAAQQSGREITPALIAEVDKLAEAYVRQSMATEEAANRIESLRDNVSRGADAVDDLFWSIADGSKTAKQAVLDLIVQMIRVQTLNRAKSVAQQSSGGGILGWLGGLLQRRAVGGPASAGQPYLVNENTPRSEIFVPSRNGAVLSVPQAKAALRDRSGGSSATAQPQAYLFAVDRGVQAQVLQQSQLQSMQMIYRTTQSQNRTQLTRAGNAEARGYR